MNTPIPFLPQGAPPARGESGIGCRFRKFAVSHVMRKSWMAGRALHARRGEQRTARPAFFPAVTGALLNHAIPVLKLCSALCVLVFSSARVQAAPDAAGQTNVQLTIDLRDGSRVIGKSLEDTLSLHSALIGDMKLAWTRIRSIECAAGSDTARLTAANGDGFAMQFAVQSLGVDTSFGKTELPVKLIRSVKVSAAGQAGQWPSDLPAGLVALWSGEGNSSDGVGGNTGTMCGNATFAEGKIGQAFSFDGVNSYVRIPQSPHLNLTDQITICFWMKAGADNPMNTFQGLVTSDFYAVEISNGYGGRMGVNFVVSTTANAPMDSSGHTSVANYTHISQANGGGAPVTPGLWHHIAATYDGAKLQLYVDGRPWGNPVGETGCLVPMRPGSFLAIGSEDGRTSCPDCPGNRYFKGLIDEVAIYNRALSAAEIQAVCTAQNNGEPLPPPSTSPWQSNGTR